MIASLLRRTLAIAVDRPRLTLWTLVAATCALFVVGAAAVTADTVDHWTTAPRSASTSMVVYLGEGVDEAHAKLLAAELARQPGVDRAELVPPVESAKRLQQSLGVDAALLDGVDLASLPASVEVTLAPGVRDVIAMSPTLRALRGTPGVDDVVIEDGDANADRGTTRHAGTLATLRTIAWTAAALVAVLALIVVLASLRVRLERDRQERAVLQLLGAHPAFTLIPTALAGALQGAVAALLAAGAVVAVIAAYGDQLASSFGNAIASPALPAIAIFVGLGAALGLLGGGIAGASRVAR